MEIVEVKIILTMAERRELLQAAEAANTLEEIKAALIALIKTLPVEVRMP